MISCVFISTNTYFYHAGPKHMFPYASKHIKTYDAIFPMYGLVVINISYGTENIYKL